MFISKQFELVQDTSILNLQDIPDEALLNVVVGIRHIGYEFDTLPAKELKELIKKSSIKRFVTLDNPQQPSQSSHWRCVRAGAVYFIVTIRPTAIAEAPVQLKKVRRS